MPGDTSTERWRESLSDDDVVGRVRAGEIALFEILMRRHNQRVYRAARAILKDDSEAEDVMQDAYVKAYAHLDQFAGRASFATWLTKIAVYEALARIRRRRQVEEPEAFSADGDPMAKLTSTAPGPEQQAFAGELRVLVEATVDALPQSYRVVFMLREIEGMTTAETAESLGLNQDTVKTRLHRAKALLRQGLYQRAGIEHAGVFQLHLSRCDRVVSAVLQGIASLSLPDHDDELCERLASPTGETPEAEPRTSHE